MLQQDIDLFTKLPNGGYLIVPGKTLSTLRRYRQRKPTDKEAGGTLIGCLRQHKSGNLVHVEVTGCTEPKLPDKRTRFGFERLGKHHLRNILQAWSRSGGKESYVGEWHTHPESHPSPSFEDVRQWQKKLSGRESILLIVGIDNEWIGFWDGNKPITLEPLKTDGLPEKG